MVKISTEMELVCERCKSDLKAEFFMARTNRKATLKIEPCAVCLDEISQRPDLWIGVDLAKCGSVSESVTQIPEDMFKILTDSELDEINQIPEGQPLSHQMCLALGGLLVSYRHLRYTHEYLKKKENSQ